MYQNISPYSWHALSYFLFFFTIASQSMAPGPIAPASPESLLEMHVLGPHFGPTDSEAPGLRPGDLPSRALQATPMLKFESHYISFKKKKSVCKPVKFFYNP